jgi:hypothetical protein
MSDQDIIAELTVAKSEQNALLKRLVEKQGREGLVPKKVQVNRGGKTFTQTVFVRPGEAQPGMSREAKLDDLANEAWGHMNERERRAALGGVTTGYWKNPWSQLSSKDKQLVIRYLQEHHPESVRIDELSGGKKPFTLTPEEHRKLGVPNWGKPVDLSPEELNKVKTFLGLKNKGHKTFQSANEAKRLASEAADQLNASTQQGYTVYGSDYHSYDNQGNSTGYFAVVGVGAGETKGQIATRAKKLRDMGWNATPIDNEDIKGIVVTS